MMKSPSLVFSLLALAASSTVFAPSQNIIKPSALYMFEQDAARSQALPFLLRPPALKGTLAGDDGFDPFDLAKSESNLMKYREGEVKHAHLVMLAAAGWPLSELFDNPLLGDGDCVPSLLNEGLGKISSAYRVGCIGLAAIIEILGTL